MKFIVIDGNIGCGKTTLINNLENFLNKERVFILREDVDQWKKSGILDKYYENPKKLAFTFQMQVAVSHLKKINNLINFYGNDITIISERSSYSCFHIFTKMLEKIGYMTDDEIKIHEELCLNCGIKPDIYIYLSTNVDEVMERIVKRNRETNITKDYLEELDKQYEQLKLICKNDNIEFYEVNANNTIEDVFNMSVERINEIIYKKN